jgi:hypothetical protein
MNWNCVLAWNTLIKGKKAKLLLTKECGTLYFGKSVTQSIRDAEVQRKIMTDKAKRKNDDPIPRRYWWIFGTLATMLLIGLRYPIRILTIWSLNPIIYAMLAISSLLAAGYVMRRYGWKQQIVAVMILCSLLSGWQGIVSARQGGLNADFCGVDTSGFLTHHRCSYVGNCPTLLRDYVTIGNLPIGIELLDYYDNPCGYPRSRW